MSFPAGGGIVELTSTGATITITDPEGPVTNVEGTGGSGAVSSVFTRTGAVVATTGDYTAAQVGADASGAAAAAPYPPWSITASTTPCAMSFWPRGDAR